jgi:hypothetical protein
MSLGAPNSQNNPANGYWNSQPVGKAAYPVFSPTSAANGGPMGNQNSAVPSTAHTGGILVGLGDASVRFVAQGISPTTWWAAATPNVGDIVGPDW